MPGAGRSTAPLVRIVGIIVALTAVVGYVVFGWSFDSPSNTIPTAIGLVVAVTAVGWTIYSHVSTS